MKTIWILLKSMTSRRSENDVWVHHPHALRLHFVFFIVVIVCCDAVFDSSRNEARHRRPQPLLTLRLPLIPRLPRTRHVSTQQPSGGQIVTVSHRPIDDRRPFVTSFQSSWQQRTRLQLMRPADVGNWPQVDGSQRQSRVRSAADAARLLIGRMTCRRKRRRLVDVASTVHVLSAVGVAVATATALNGYDVTIRADAERLDRFHSRLTSHLEKECHKVALFARVFMDWHHSRFARCYVWVVLQHNITQHNATQPIKVRVGHHFIWTSHFSAKITYKNLNCHWFVMLYVYFNVNIVHYSTSQ